MPRFMVGCLVVTLAAIGVVPCHAHADVAPVTAAPNHCDTAGGPDRPEPAPAADCCLDAPRVAPAVPLIAGHDDAGNMIAVAPAWQSLAPVAHELEARPGTPSRSAPRQLRPTVLLI